MDLCPDRYAYTQKMELATTSDVQCDVSPVIDVTEPVTNGVICGFSGIHVF